MEGLPSTYRDLTEVNHEHVGKPLPTSTWGGAVPGISGYRSYQNSIWWFIYAMVFISYKPTAMGIWWYFLVRGLGHGFYLMGKNRKISSDHIWLMVWNMAFIFHMLGMSASQLTLTPSFFRGVGFFTSQFWFNPIYKPFVTHIWESSIEYPLVNKHRPWKSPIFNGN